MFLRHLIVGLFVLLCVGAAGCGKPPVAPPPEANAAEESHNHEGWWCGEHGMPEDLCAQCNSKLAAQFKAKGDWCKEHDVPESQCFACRPDLEQKFAAQYEAKYGKKPPKQENDHTASADNLPKS